MNKSLYRPYFDFLRGIAIIMVVGIHTIPNHSLGFESLEEICTIILRSFLNCAVPLFLAISGYFNGKKRISTSKEHLAFLMKQIPKVYVPCLVFSLPYLAISLYSDPYHAFKLLATFFLCGFSVYYFIALIIQYYILLPVFVKINKYMGGITLGISLLSILLVTYVMKGLGYSFPLLIYAGFFPLWIMFFFMGVYFSDKECNYSLFGPSVVIVVGLMLQLIEYKYWLSRGQIALGIKFSSFIFSFGIIWYLFSNKIEKRYTENVILNWISRIGGLSFGIYLMHCYVIRAIYRLFPNIQSWALKWTLVLCVTLLGIWAIKSLLPRFSNKYLGFR